MASSSAADGVVALMMARHGNFDIPRASICSRGISLPGVSTPLVVSPCTIRRCLQHGHEFCNVAFAFDDLWWSDNADLWFCS